MSRSRRTRIVLGIVLLLALASGVVVFRQLRIYNGKWGFVNTRGRFVIAPRYEAVKHFSQGLAPVCTRLDNPYAPAGTGRWGYIDTSGRLIAPPRFDRANPFRDGFASVQRQGKWGFIDAKGTLVIPCRYDGVLPFAQGRAVVNVGGNYKDGRTTEGKWGLIDEQGNTVLQPRYDELFSFSKDGLALFRDGCKWNGIRPIGGHCGFIDREGQVAIAPEWDNAHPFQDGLATVCTGMDWANRPYRSGRWGCIDKQGKLVIECRFDQPLQFVHGYAIAALDSDPHRVGLLDKHGAFIVPPKFAALTRLGNGLYAANAPSALPDRLSQGGLWGIYRRDGTELFTPQFTGIHVVPPMSDFAYLQCFKPGQKQPLFLDPDGQVLSRPPATITKGHNHYRFRASPSGGFAIRDMSGKTLSTIEYAAECGHFDEGLAPVRTKTLIELFHLERLTRIFPLNYVTPKVQAIPAPRSRKPTH